MSTTGLQKMEIPVIRLMKQKVKNCCIKMLFLLSAEHGKGVGKQLLQYGIENYGIQELTVNEQNPQAVGFYRHMGFETYKRTDYDEEGNPYPLLYMKKI